MKRIFSVFAVTALMVAMLLASAMPAFAANGGKSGSAPNCGGGQFTAAFGGKDDKGFSKHIERAFGGLCHGG